jgi:Sec-independent protein translocase protein TatA
MPTDLALVLIVILVLVVIWRGPKTLPQLGQALGRGIREARRGARAEPEDETDSTERRS